ncbi:MAG: methionyl-tRNA formyltransferase [Syntrophomonas sp.]
MKNEALKILFMGTSLFAVPSLEALAGPPHHLVGVVSQPDRPRGRGRRLQPTPVKEAALRYGIPVLQFDRIRDELAVQGIKELGPDLIVVVSYGQILPPDLLKVPKWGCVNVHASLLPHYRGAAPIQRAIMDGLTVTGVSTMLMDVGMDTGDILLQEEVPIPDEIDHGGLETRLAQVGAGLLTKTVAGMSTGSIKPVPQEHDKASYAAMISREDELISWNSSAREIHNRIRALSPFPGAYTMFQGERLKLYRSRVFKELGQGPEGVFLFATNDGLVFQTRQGALEILEVQKAGKKRMAAREFIKGYPLAQGSRLSG